MKRLLVAALAALALAACGTSAPTELDRYKTMCHDKNGVVSPVEQDSWTIYAWKCAGDKGELLARFGGTN